MKMFIESTNPDSLFFSRNNMKFAGDTMANYGVKRTTINGGVEVFELFRKKPVMYGLAKSAYFHAETFKQVFIKE